MFTAKTTLPTYRGKLMIGPRAARADTIISDESRLKWDNVEHVGKNFAKIGVRSKMILYSFYFSSYVGGT